MDDQRVVRNDLKWDEGKSKYSLIVNKFLDHMAEILTKGEENHPAIDGTPSWQFVEPEAYIDAMYRHIYEYRSNPKSVDLDMHTPHMAHVAVNAMFLSWFATHEQRMLPDGS